MRAILSKLLAAVLLSLCALPTFAAEMTLVTSNGDRLRGAWVDGDDSQVSWQAKDFVGPFQYACDTITAVYGPRDEGEEGEQENLCICELVSGDVLLGTPLSLNAKELRFAIESLDPDKAVETLSIPRGELKRLTAPMATNEVLVDLPGDGESLMKNKRGDWEVQGGEIVAKSPDAKCFAKLPELPLRCLVEFEISWDRGTDFCVCLTPQKREVRGQERNLRLRRPARAGNRLMEPGEHSGLRLESWNNQLVLMARTHEEADVLLIDSDGSRTAGSLRMQMFIDAEKKTVNVYRDGAFVGNLRMPGGVEKSEDKDSDSAKADWARMSEVARLESFSGSLSLESYRISSWNGQTPFTGNGAESVVRMIGGENVTGTVTGWDAKSKEFIVEIASAESDEETADEETADEETADEEKADEENADKKTADDDAEEEKKDGDEEDSDEEDSDEEEAESDDKPKKKKAVSQRIAMTKMSEIIFGGSRVAAKEGEKLAAGNVSLTTKRGSRIDGEFKGVKQGRAYVRSKSLKQTASFAVSDIAAVNFSSLEKPEAEEGDVVGTLRLDDSMMRGSLKAGKSSGDATCLSWRPLAALNSVALVPESSGTIVYRTPKKKVVKKPNAKARPRRGVIAGFAQALKDVTKEVDDSARAPRVAPVKAGDLMTLELRSGDSIPFRPKRIDEDGVTFESPLSKVTFVPHDQVKAISLRSRCTPAELTAIKRERLLTVPRRYQERPPTHLLLSVNKDILRGRLIAMDDTTVIIETALTPRRIPRDRIAAIVWLDGVVDPNAEAGDSGDDDAVKDDEPDVQPKGFHVLATKRGGQRITIIPDRCADSVLHGKNPVLEDCQLDLSEVDQLAFGSDINTVVGKLAVSQIVLTSAAQPRFMEDEGDEGGGGQTGQEAALVGKPAPPIELERLDGNEYDLADETGKIVVLDFWATWCGPCIQWMPRAEAIVEEFPEDNVELVAVNLSETAEEINPVLKRLDLHPTVLLDIDGVVADAYKATAIPQTVVIDREGKVDRVLVGGGKQNEERLRDAIKSLVNPDA